MKKSVALNWLIPLIAVLALTAALVGLFWQEGGGSFSFTTAHGQTIQMYGKGIYRFDSLQGGATFRGTDLVTLVVSLPLLILSFVFYRRGSLRGGFLLIGALAYFLYNFASMAFSTAYNSLFLVYVTGFSASLFAFVLAFLSVDLYELPDHVSPRLPHRGPAWFLIIVGVILALIWLSDIVGAFMQGQQPLALMNYTTIFTYALDIGVITPTAVLAGWLLLRRVPLGYVISFAMLVLNALIGIVVAMQTVFQALVGISYTPAQFVVFVASFVVLSLVAVGFVIAFYLNLSDRKLQHCLEEYERTGV